MLVSGEVRSLGQKKLFFPFELRKSIALYRFFSYYIRKVRCKVMEETYLIEFSD